MSATVPEAATVRTTGIAPHGVDAAAGRIRVVHGGTAARPDDVLEALRRDGFLAETHLVDTALRWRGAAAWDVWVIDTEPLAALGLIRALRADAAFADVPVLVVGDADAWRQEAVSPLAAGANDFVVRPIERSELGRRVANLTELARLRRLHGEERQRIQKELSARTATLDALIETGLMMSMEQDRGRLLRRLLDEGRRLLHCDGATMYMVTDEKTLRFELRTRDDALPSLQIPLHDPATGRPNECYVSVFTALRNRSVRIDDVYAEPRFDLRGTRAFDEASGYRTVSMLTVPIAPRGGEAIGVLQFINALDPATGRIVPFPAERVGLVEALAAQAAVALDNLALVESQKQLMESLIRVLATAIDAKSPYTGRHCERVPQLAFLLAEAACEATDGPLADFAFRSEQEWQEFRIGAWLHDCGKVTTPEYVIDKATKLETIQNRLHEVRTRFEVLLRDVEIERLEARLAGPPDPAREAALDARRVQLADDFAFVARCNIGSEAMSEADVEHLARIARTPWLRHLDDRLGLSDAELDRRSAEPATALPATESLLADRVHHLVPRGAEEGLDPAFGFKMDVPEHLFNHGELYNLSVRRGTLTREERYKINEHMVHTVMMLERMPFPKHLKRVPEYAGTHHERVDGRGYPRRLRREDLSVPSRIMAVADIFEALTAADRPYKQPKKLSEALSVLQGMAGAHIDADIFNLFLTSGVVLAFGSKYLHPEQMDVDDPTRYLVAVAGPAASP